MRPPIRSPASTAGSLIWNVIVVADLLAELVVVGLEEHQRGQSGRTDRVALRDGLRRVSDRVERVGDVVAHLVRQVGHLGDPAGVVGDRAERVEGDDHARHREHRRDGDRDPVDPGQVERRDRPERDHDDRQRGGLHADGEPGDDVRRVARQRLLGDPLHRAEAGARVVLGDRDDQRRDDEADQRAPVEVGRARTVGERPEPVGAVRDDRDVDDRREHGRDDDADVERVDHAARLGQPHHERADDRRGDRERREQERQPHGVGVAEERARGTSRRRWSRHTSRRGRPPCRRRRPRCRQRCRR